jgi:hypothetical protein
MRWPLLATNGLRPGKYSCPRSLSLTWAAGWKKWVHRAKGAKQKEFNFALGRTRKRKGIVPK